MTPQQNKTIHRVIQVFGKRNQTMQSIEELMELQKALFENVHRGTDNIDNIIEEIADVEIMLAQLKQIYNIDQNKIEEVKDYKLQRLNITIDKYLQKNPKKTDKNSIHINRVISNGQRE